MIILASKSPRRKELLSYLFDQFEIIPAEGEEIAPNGVSLDNASLFLAEQKAAEIAQKHPDDLIIGADTVVIFKDEIFGKPKDKLDAERMLKSLSGTVHKVITGVCVIKNGEKKSFKTETLVEFFKLSDKDIESYIDSGEPFDKAGAYGIQDRGCLLVKRIDGDYYNVMGLPVGALKEILSELA